MSANVNATVTVAAEKKEKRLPTSVYLGVCLDKKAGKYRAQYAFEKRILFLGYSMCQEELAMKYDLLVQLLVGSSIPTNCNAEFYAELLEELRSRSRDFTAHECCVMIRKMDLSSRVPQFLDKVSPDTMALKKMRGANFARGEGLAASALGNQAVMQCINGSVINVQGHPRDLRSDLDYLNSHTRIETISEESGGAGGNAKKNDKNNDDINLHTSDDEQTVSESPERVISPVKRRRLHENPLLRATEVWISAESPRKDTATSAPPKDSSVEIVELPSTTPAKDEKPDASNAQPAAAQAQSNQPQQQNQSASPFPRNAKRLSVEEAEKNMIHRICSVTQSNMAVIGATTPLRPAQHTHVAQNQNTAQAIPTIKYEARPASASATTVELNPLKLISSVIAVDDNIYNRINNLQGTQQRAAISDDDYSIIDFATTTLERQGILTSKDVVQIYSLLENNPQLRQQTVQYLRIRMRGHMDESKYQLIEKYMKDLLAASATWWSA